MLDFVLTPLAPLAAPDSQNADKNTPLHVAAAQGSLDAVTALLDAGADIAVQNKDGETAVHWCALGGGGAPARSPARGVSSLNLPRLSSPPPSPPCPPCPQPSFASLSINERTYHPSIVASTAGPRPRPFLGAC